MSESSGSNRLLNISLVLLGLLVIILLLAAVFLGWQYVELNKSIIEKETIIMKQNFQKDSLNNEIDELKNEIRIQQDRFNLDAENALNQLENLRVNLKSTGGENISFYKKEIKKLKEELANYQQKISTFDSKELDYQKQLEQFKSDMRTLEAKNQVLQSEKQELNTKVETGAVLQISAINCKSYFVSKKGKEKEIAKAGKVNKLECCFTIFRNKLAEKGNRTAYLVIKKPGGNVIKTQRSEFFETNNGMVNYSSKQEFAFQGDNTEVCISVDLDEELDKGKYIMEVYIDKQFTSEQTIELK